MKQPDHPAKAAFDKAARDPEAARIRQIALLTQQQRQRLDELRDKEKQNRKEAEGRQKATRDQRIEEETRRQLLAKHHFILTMFHARTSKNVKDAAAHAASIVDTKDAVELQTLARQAEERLDRFLEDAEEKRARQEGQREDLRAYFNKVAAEKDGPQRDRLDKDDPEIER